MNFPFKIIESKISSRDQFEMVDGCQPTHALFYLKEGSFTMETDGGRYEITAGDCVILPDYLHFKRSVVLPIVFVYVKFAYDSDSNFSISLPEGKAEFKDKARFVSNITLLEKLLENDDVMSAFYRTHILNDILFQLYRENNPVGSLQKPYALRDKLTAAAVKYIRENIDKKPTIDDVCRAVSTNASTLNFKFNKHLGMSVGRYIIDVRIKRAKHFLVSTTYPLCEVAVRSGFDNAFYFSNAFKKYCGISPSQYRKQNQPI